MKSTEPGVHTSLSGKNQLNSAPIARLQVHVGKSASISFNFTVYMYIHFK